MTKPIPEDDLRAQWKNLLERLEAVIANPDIAADERELLEAISNFADIYLKKYAQKRIKP